MRSAVAQNDSGVISRAKRAAWCFIAKNRRSTAVQLLHRFSGFIDHAYQNVGLDMELNGESYLIHRLREARLRVAFDVGANYGDWLMEALNLWPDCRFHAFEVAPQTFRLLEDRVRQSAYGARVNLNCAGLSNVAGTKEMYYVPEHPNLTTSLHAINDNFAAVPFEALITTGDGYASDHKIEAIDFVKIDVEGMEYPVLEGLRECLSQGRVHCLQFEYSPFAIRTKHLLFDFYSLLSDKYWLGKVYPNYVDFRDYDWPMENFVFANYCAVSKSMPVLRDMLSQ